ncbi:hypothetical protein CSOJ01_04207 [Colletotrichum sojae]|uniref:Uncharacterized protein n=1 Tax=Colletotrichum sojae TaxID=2175907 RepID=A0A8H6JJV9_9PEZI|nr:hypothetical protein CSOJ01_04207 [Colletotrichum sojae]
MLGEYATGDVGTRFNHITKRSRRRVSDRTWPDRTGSGDTRHRGRPQNVTKTPKQPGSQEVRWDAMQSQPFSCAMPGVLSTDNTADTHGDTQERQSTLPDSGLKAVSTLIVTVTVAVDVKQRPMRAVVKGTTVNGSSQLPPGKGCIAVQQGAAPEHHELHTGEAHAADADTEA